MLEALEGGGGDARLGISWAGTTMTEGKAGRGMGLVMIWK